MLSVICAYFGGGGGGGCVVFKKVKQPQGGFMCDSEETASEVLMNV
jgi:hypothetical protein